MRLYLSSFRLGHAAAHLRELAGGSGRTAVIANATDARTSEQRVEAIETEIDLLSDAGLAPEHLDLRDFYGRDDVKDALAAFDLLWLRGGNLFMLRHALARSAADSAIVELLADDAVCYGGYSAGPCVLGGPLNEFAYVDDPTDVTTLYGEPAPMTGLEVLDWTFVPHVASPGHPESEACEEVAFRYERAGAAVRRFTDGDVLVIHGSSERIFRSPATDASSGLGR